MALKVKALRVTAPNGKHFDICDASKLGYGNRQDFQNFFTWACENTNLMTSILAALGMDPYVKAADRPREAKGDQVLGTCPVCGRLQCVRSDETNMVLHGYQRPGGGFIVGDCFGTNYPAYEISPDGCTAYVIEMQRHIDKLSAILVSLRSGEIQKVTVQDGYTKVRGRVVPNTVDVGPDDKRFAPRLQRMVDDNERDRKLAIEVKVEMEQKFRDWKPGTLTRRAG
jgi:hypothetical protein